MAWYHTFFEGVPQQAWKLGQDELRTGLEVDFLYEVLGLGEDSHVLDVFSGYGRHALPVARLGVQVWGIDVSREACEELTIASREEHLGVQVLCEDFLEADLPPREMDAAYCMGNSFSFFDRSGMRQFLSKIHASLKAGGRFAAHSAMLAESVLPQFQQKSWMEVGEDAERILYLADNDYDAVNGVIHADITYVLDGSRHSYRVDQWIYTLAELTDMFREAGLEVVEVFSDIDGEPFRVGDEEVFIVAEKK